VGPSEDVREDLEQTAPDQYGPTPLGQANSTSSPYTIANSSSTFVGTTASPCTKDFQVGGQEELTSPAVHAASPQTRTQRPLHDINGFYEEPILDDIHQACLLKHYIDELSYWVRLIFSASILSGVGLIRIIN
jgi:hypothetical protein